MSTASDSAPPIPEAREKILVIDDESVIGLSCRRVFEPLGHQVTVHDDARTGLRAASSGQFDVILLDLMMPGMDGLELLRRLKAAAVPSEVIIITGHATVESAVGAMKLGAADYLAKPFSPEQLSMVVSRVCEHSALVRENAALRRELEINRGFEGILGRSPAMLRVYSLIKRVAPTDCTVLVSGESGTGKGLVAQAIHRLSRRKEQPLLTCDCTTMAPVVLENELFGHVPGALAGAVGVKQGLFEAADKGTLLLNDVANLTAEAQGKLLRVLETRLVRRVGDIAEFEVDVRLIAATNRDLMDMISEGTFRDDLYHRLNVVPIYLPPLRERPGDIPVLAMAYLERVRKQNDLKVLGFTPEAMSRMEGYRWAGNVRELHHLVERMAILCDADRVDLQHLPAEIRQAPPRSTAMQLPGTWEEFKRLKHQARDAAVQELERRFLIEAIERAGGNITKAAENVGIQRPNFHALMRKYGLTSGTDL